MPYIIARRPEIQNGSVQITDLFPNDSQRNLVNDPVGQGPFYVRIPNTGLVGSSRAVLKVNSDNSIEFLRSCDGLLAYLIAHVEVNPGGNAGAGPALTITQAETAVANIISEVESGNALTIAVINGILTAADVGNGATDLDSGSVVGSNSTGSLSEVLAILSGETYTINGGVAVQDLNGVKAPVVAPGTLGSTVRTLVPNDSSWKISFSEGALQGLTTVRDAVNGDFFAGVQSTAPLLTVYNDDGTLYS